ncbi:MAG: hypothetical protein ACFFDO_08695 [Candidatus Thorarchaeota archaeon]
MFYIAIKGFKAKNHYGGSSTIICGIFFIIFGLYNLFFWFFPYPYNGFMIWWSGIILIIFISFASIIKQIIKQMNREELNSKNLKISRLRKFVLLMTQENLYKEKISVKMETVRKSFHLAGFGFILAYFGFFFLFPVTRIVNDTVIVFIKETEWLYNMLWGDIHDYPYSKGDFQAVVDLTFFALIGALFFAIISDIIRILWGPEYSIFNFLTKAVLRDKEYNAFAAHIYLISGFIFSYMLYFIGIVHILIVVAAILISCFSDALAALIGRKYGKHKVKCIGGEIKSTEGFLAGTVSAFLIGLIVIGPVYALIAAVIFFILDFFPTIIADNLLNPIFITTGIAVSMILLGLPIGWF